VVPLSKDLRLVILALVWNYGSCAFAFAASPRNDSPKYVKTPFVEFESGRLICGTVSSGNLSRASTPQRFQLATCWPSATVHRQTALQSCSASSSACSLRATTCSPRRFMSDEIADGSRERPKLAANSGIGSRLQSNELFAEAEGGCDRRPCSPRTRGFEGAARPLSDILTHEFWLEFRGWFGSPEAVLSLGSEAFVPMRMITMLFSTSFTPPSFAKPKLIGQCIGIPILWSIFIAVIVSLSALRSVDGEEPPEPARLAKKVYQAGGGVKVVTVKTRH
jgi:hypothetical protein